MKILFVVHDFHGKNKKKMRVWKMQLQRGEFIKKFLGRGDMIDMLVKCFHSGNYSEGKTDRL